MINLAKWKIYAVGAGVVLAGIIAAAAWWNARDERLRREGEHRAEVRALTERSDSLLRARADSAATRDAEHAARIAALEDSLRVARDQAAVSREAARNAGFRADVAVAELARDSTAGDSVQTLVTALTERTREAAQWEQTAERERMGREIAERAAEALQGQLRAITAERVADLALISDLRAQIASPLSQPPRPSFLARVGKVARVVGEAALVVAVVVLAAGKK